MDVRLGTPAHLGGQQPRGASARLGRGMDARLGLPQWLPARADARESRKVHHRLQPPHHRVERRILFLQAPDGFPPRNSRGESFFHARSARSQARSESEGHVRRVSALHFAGEDAVSGKQSGECALVSRARTPRHRAAAALECRRDRLQQPLPRVEHARALPCCG